MSRKTFQKSTTTPQLVQKIYDKSTANLQQIDLLWICCIG